ncbi:MAG: DHHA1 domain-containing protein [Nitrososphaerota archaeon]|nr:DHHA1 domain-containing protein [Candidatus Bathyarchaeota archaeon]MDW8062076.1 DHHA1 domain-containing protein [Nitrososphaerota archaeon]
MRRNLKIDIDRIRISTPTGLYRVLRSVSSMNPSTIIVCDIAVDTSHMSELIDLIRSLTSSKCSIYYIDHHPPPLGFPPIDLDGFKYLYRLGVSASQLVYEALGKPDDRISRILMTYGAIGDMCDESQLVKDTLSLWDKRLIYLEAGFIVEGLISGRDRKFIRELIDKLAQGNPPSSIPELVSSCLKTLSEEYKVYKYIEENVTVRGRIAIVSKLPVSGFGGKAANYALTCTKADVAIAITVSGGIAYMSLRSSNPRIDLNDLTRRLSTALGGHGGGHLQSAAARIPVSRIEEFLMFMEIALSSMS